MEGKVFIYQEDRRHYSLELGPWICLRKSPSAPWDRNSGRCSGGHGQSHRTDPGTSFFPAPRCGSTSSCRTCLKPVCRTRRVRTGTKRSCPSEHEPPPRGNDAESRAAGPPPRRHRPRASPPSAEKRPPAVPFALSLCPRVHMVIPGQLRSRLLRAVGTQMARDTLAVSSPGWTSRLPTEAAPPPPRTMQRRRGREGAPGSDRREARPRLCPEPGPWGRASCQGRHVGLGCRGRRAAFWKGCGRSGPALLWRPPRAFLVVAAWSRASPRPSHPPPSQASSRECREGAKAGARGARSWGLRSQEAEEAWFGDTHARGPGGAAALGSPCSSERPCRPPPPARARARDPPSGA